MKNAWPPTKEGGKEEEEEDVTERWEGVDERADFPVEADLLTIQRPDVSELVDNEVQVTTEGEVKSDV